MNTLDLIQVLDAKPWAAFLALSLLANVYLFRANLKAQRAHMDDLRVLAPLAENMSGLVEDLKKMLEMIGQRAKRRRKPITNPAIVLPKGGGT